ncbi:hypothetical protein ['Cynodon dactylon' phytoplasma]|uniref:hypothetical protein n=1 Tax='Cynodon dactylon' phytoplasma TaxID=295320 RepID=UPI001265AE75|nr:hypothetical protein ['Cynodon dactylon' phytoplasma]KAB8121684.1 hypothetical protein F1741_02180 ['Cynodon dactylon' phytoplasma]
MRELLNILDEKSYVALVGNFLKHSKLEFKEGKDGSWCHFKLSVNQEYRKKINNLNIIEVICYISRPTTQIRCLKRYFDNKESSVLVVGSLKNMVIYAVNITFLKTRTRLGFDS